MPLNKFYRIVAYKILEKILQFTVPKLNLDSHGRETFTCSLLILSVLSHRTTFCSVFTELSQVLCSETHFLRPTLNTPHQTPSSKRITMYLLLLETTLTIGGHHVL